MGVEQKNIKEHVGELLSGLLDGELTQQQRQWVTLHCQSCETCRNDLAALRLLRERITTANLSEIGEDKWRETMDDQRIKTPRKLGWLLFIGGLLAIGIVVLVEFLFNDEVAIGIKLIMIAIYGGLASLFYSALRQRLIERKTDKYKDVEI